MITVCLLKCSLFRKIWKEIVQQTEVRGCPDGGAAQELEADLSMRTLEILKGFRATMLGSHAPLSIRAEAGALG